MTVGEAKAHAREWAAERAKQLPDFAGAFVFGSICLRNDEEPFLSTSDVDVRIVVDGEGHDLFREVEGEYRAQAIPYKGLDIEVACDTPTKTFEDPEQILGHESLAPAFRIQNVLLDPTGILSAVHPVVSAGYAQERWVRARCAGQKGFMEWDLHMADPLQQPVPEPLPGYVDAHIERVNFFCGGAAGLAGILCIADLGGPTMRRSLANGRNVLEAYSMPSVSEALLEALKSQTLTKTDVLGFLGEMGGAFDLACEHVRTPFFPGLFLLQPFLREKHIDGVGELISEGLHREIILSLAFIRSTVQNAIENDAPAAVREETRAGYRRFLSALGIESDAALGRKVERLRQLVPEVMAAAETIIARNQAVEHA